MPEENNNPLEQLHAARQQVTALTSERDGLRGQVLQLTTDRQSLQSQLNDANATIARLTGGQPPKNLPQGGNPNPGTKVLSLTEQCLAVTNGKDQIHRGD